MKTGKILSLLCVLALFSAAPAAARHGKDRKPQPQPQPSASSQAYKTVTEGQKVQARQIKNSRQMQKLGDDILRTSDEQAYQSHRNNQIRQREKNRKRNNIW